MSGARRPSPLAAWLLALALLAAAPASALDFDQIVRDSKAEAHEVTCQRMLAWVDAHPSDARAGRALVWMAQLRLADGRPELAEPLFRRTERDYPGTEWELHAVKGLADIDMSHWRFGRAIEAYERLAHGGSPFFQYVGAQAASNARGVRLRLGSAALILLAWALFLGLRVRASGGASALWPPPPLVGLVGPIPVLLLLAAFGQPAPEWKAVALLGLLALAVLWGNGAYHRGRVMRGRRLGAEVALGLVQAACLLYCAVVVSGLWEKFRDTLAMGAE